MGVSKKNWENFFPNFSSVSLWAKNIENNDKEKFAGPNFSSVSL